VLRIVDILVQIRASDYALLFSSLAFKMPSFQSFSAYLFLKKDKKSKRRHKTIGIQVLLTGTIFA
jgi:hypothetical protein